MKITEKIFNVVMNEYQHYEFNEMELVMIHDAIARGIRSGWMERSNTSKEPPSITLESIACNEWMDAELPATEPEKPVSPDQMEHRPISFRPTDESIKQIIQVAHDNKVKTNTVVNDNSPNLAALIPITKRDFFFRINQPDHLCEPQNIELKRLWKMGNSTAIKNITGLDFSDMIGDKHV